MLCRIRGLDIAGSAVGEGTPVVMVHGMGVDHRVMSGCMEPVFEARSEPWKRIYFDLPGMGRTEGAGWVTSSDEAIQLAPSVRPMPGRSK